MKNSVGRFYLTCRQDSATIAKVNTRGIQSSSIPKEALPCKNLKGLELVNTSIQKVQKSLQKSKNLKTIGVFNNPTNKH